MTVSPTRKRVLYVEASDLVQASVVPLITGLNCAVSQASSLDTALAELNSNDPFDLILLGDLTRPSQVNDEGPQAELTIIKQAREANRDIPILIFTSQNYLNLAYEAGATSHMIKPTGAGPIIDFISPFLRARVGVRS